MQAFDERVRQHVIPRQLGIAPDPGLLAQELADPDTERSVQVGHPALSSLDQFLVVEVGVADERVPGERHDGQGPRTRRPTWLIGFFDL